MLIYLCEVERQLPHTHAEARQLRQLLGPDAVDVVGGDIPTLAAQLRRRRYGVLHIICHGYASFEWIGDGSSAAPTPLLPSRGAGGVYVLEAAKIVNVLAPFMAAPVAAPPSADPPGAAVPRLLTPAAAAASDSVCRPGAAVAAPAAHSWTAGCACCTPNVADGRGKLGPMF